MKMIFFQMDRIIPSIFLVKVIGTCVYSVIISSECLGRGERQMEGRRCSIPIIMSRNTLSRMGGSERSFPANETQEIFY